LVDEIIPDVVLSKYDIVEDPDGWGVSGHSSGGIVAFMAGWYRPDKFHKLLTHNASFSNTKGVFPAEPWATLTGLLIAMLSQPEKA